MTPELLRAYRFHLVHSACVVGHHAESALSLARAELAARELGWTFAWVPDPDPDISWMSEAERAREHTVELCMVWDDDAGEELAALGGITDATDDYRRTIEAELALEADARMQLDAAHDALDTETVPGALGRLFA